MMTNEFDILKTLVNELTTCSDELERLCLHYGEIRAKLQLEVYKLLQNNKNTEELTKAIANIVENDKRVQTKFFREKV